MGAIFLWYLCAIECVPWTRGRIVLAEKNPDLHQTLQGSTAGHDREHWCSSWEHSKCFQERVPWWLGFLGHCRVQRRRQWHPTPVPLPGKSHGQRSLVGCSPWGHEESDTTEQLHFHFSLSCIGEGNGNPLQCSCLENPRDGGAWWAAVYGVTQSRTRLKWLSSSSRVQAPVMPRAHRGLL